MMWIDDVVVLSGGYSGYLVWRSGADLPGYYGDGIQIRGHY